MQSKNYGAIGAHMKIRVFFTLFFLVLAGMAGANLIVEYISAKTQSELKATEKELTELQYLCDDIVISSQWQIRSSRAYIETKDFLRKILFNRINLIFEGAIARPPNYKVRYWDLIISRIQDLPQYYDGPHPPFEERFTIHNITSDELLLIHEIHNIYTKLTSIERVAMNAVDGKFDDGTGTFPKTSKPDPGLAHKLLYNQDASQLSGELSLKVENLINQFAARYAASIKKMKDFDSSLLWINSLINASLFAIITGSMIYLHVGFSNRAKSLMNVVLNISQGDLTKRAPEGGADEISDLSNVINEMADNLRLSFDQLQDKVRTTEETLYSLDIEKRRVEKLLNNILPAAIAERLRDGEETIAEIHPEVTVFFSDIVGFTELSAKIGPTETVRLLNDIFGEFDELADRHKIEKIKTIGDSYMVVGGVPTGDSFHCHHVASFAIDVRAFLDEFSKGLNYPLQMRIGIHTGTVAAGVVGKKRFSYDLWGDVVNIASRFESACEPDKIHVSQAVKIRLENDYTFADGGLVELKGKGITKSYYLIGTKSDNSILTPKDISVF